MHSSEENRFNNGSYRFRLSFTLTHGYLSSLLFTLPFFSIVQAFLFSLDNCRNPLNSKIKLSPLGRLFKTSSPRPGSFAARNPLFISANVQLIIRKSECLYDSVDCPSYR